MLLGEIVFIAACGLGAAGITILTAPRWMRAGQKAWQEISKQLAHAERVRQHTDEEEN